MASALRRGLCGWLVSAACGQPAPPALSGHAPPGDPVDPAPSIAWADHAITTTGLPAIARDGSAIVVAHRDTDGGRGNPNLTLIEKDRGDRELGRVVVVTADDIDRLDAHALELRFTAATGWLEQRHAARHLTAMTALVTRPPTDDAPAQATGPGLTLRWAPNQLVIERIGQPGRTGQAGGAGGAAMTRETPASWLAIDHPLCPTCREICHNDAVLGGGYADLERAAVVVVVAYRGSDTCWEPGSQEHVVVW